MNGTTAYSEDVIEPWIGDKATRIAYVQLFLHPLLTLHYGHRVPRLYEKAAACVSCFFMLIVCLVPQLATVTPDAGRDMWRDYLSRFVFTILTNGIHPLIWVWAREEREVGWRRWVPPIFMVSNGALIWTPRVLSSYVTFEFSPTIIMYWEFALGMLHCALRSLAFIRWAAIPGPGNAARRPRLVKRVNILNLLLLAEILARRLPRATVYYEVVTIDWLLRVASTSALAILVGIFSAELPGLLGVALDVLRPEDAEHIELERLADQAQNVPDNAVPAQVMPGAAV